MIYSHVINFFIFMVCEFNLKLVQIVLFFSKKLRTALLLQRPTPEGKSSIIMIKGQKNVYIELMFPSFKVCDSLPSLSCYITMQDQEASRVAVTNNMK